MAKRSGKLSVGASDRRFATGAPGRGKPTGRAGEDQDVSPSGKAAPADNAVGLSWLLSTLNKAIEHVPYVRYAFGLVGIAAAAALILTIFRFMANQFIGTGSMTPIFLMMGLMIVLMFVLFLFAKISDENKRFLQLPAKLVAWLSVAIVIGLIAIASVVGVLQKPTHLAEMVFGRVATTEQKELRDTFKTRKIYGQYCGNLERESEHDYIETCINFSVKDLFLECSAETPDVPEGEELIPNPFACLGGPEPEGSLKPILPSQSASVGRGDSQSLFTLASSDPVCRDTLLARVLSDEKLRNGFTVKGIDISHHTKEIPWNRLVDQGVVFVIMKASEGTSFVDPAFRNNWRMAGQAGLVRGAYHVMRYDRSISMQFQRYESVLNSVGPRECDLGPALDIKSAARGKPERTQAVGKISTWLQLAQGRYKKRPLLFTSPFLLEQILRNPWKELNRAVLWLSEYSPKQPPLPSGSWLPNYVWQFSDGEQNVPDGYVGPPVDRNVFIGSAAEFADILGLRFGQ